MMCYINHTRMVQDFKNTTKWTNIEMDSYETINRNLSSKIIAKFGKLQIFPLKTFEVKIVKKR